MNWTWPVQLLCHWPQPNVMPILHVANVFDHRGYQMWATIPACALNKKKNFIYFILKEKIKYNIYLYDPNCAQWIHFRRDCMFRRH